MVESLESDDFIFDNKPIIIKDKYAVNGSDMAQIGWIEITSEERCFRLPMVHEV